jgi:hypothetical protein
MNTTVFAQSALAANLFTRLTVDCIPGLTTGLLVAANVGCSLKLAGVARRRDRAADQFGAGCAGQARAVGAKKGAE